MDLGSCGFFLHAITCLLSVYPRLLVRKNQSELDLGLDLLNLSISHLSGLFLI
jgi:hypothetical protein